MFWNDPNFYGFTYRETPQTPPFFGQTIPYGMKTPWTPVASQLPTLPQIPFGFGGNVPFFPPPTTPFAAHNQPFYGQNLPILPNVPFYPQTLPMYGQPLPWNPIAFSQTLPFPGTPYRPF